MTGGGGGGSGPGGGGGECVLAISLGDALGIGPEVTAKALADLPEGLEARVFGDVARLRRVAGAVGLGRRLDELEAGGRVRLEAVGPAVPEGGDEVPPGDDARAGAASYAAVLRAVEAVKRGEADALVTAPISKAAWRLAGITYPGHTELLADQFASPESGMLFVGPSLCVILVTIHIPLREVPTAVTPARVLTAIRLAERAARTLGRTGPDGRPRIAVAGINPHAGEGGLFGQEDALLVAPAVAEAQAQGLNVVGPVPGDAVFTQAIKPDRQRGTPRTHDVVVAMYHDQGLIAMKLLDRERTINVTVGLRHQGRAVVRTSPAHGTAFDIAGWALRGEGRADATSMLEACVLATRLAKP